MSKICVIDIGGTNFRHAVYENGAIVDGSYSIKASPSFRDTADAEALKASIEDRIVESFLICREAYPEIGALGVSFAGPIDAAGRVIQSAVIFGCLLERPFLLLDAVKEKLKKTGREPEIRITNDITASAWRYAGRGLDPFCLITVSSGIGNKVFSNGQVLLGPDGLAGELGHVPVDLDGPSIACDCGSGTNHIGMISSGRGIEFFAREFGREGGRYRQLFLNSKLATDIDGDAARIENRAIARMADIEDAFPRKVIDYCTRPLADAVRTICLSIYLKQVILIGGFALNCDYYREALAVNVLRRPVYNYGESAVREMIINGEPDDFHALIGLGKLMESHGSQDG